MKPSQPGSSDHLGDMNCHGGADNSDVEPFVLAIIDPTGFVHTVSCNIKRADMNLDNQRNGADIRPFVDKLLQP